MRPVIVNIIVLKSLFIIGFILGIAGFAIFSSIADSDYSVQAESSIFSSVGVDIFSSQPSTVEVEPEYLQVEEGYQGEVVTITDKANIEGSNQSNKSFVQKHQTLPKTGHSPQSFTGPRISINRIKIKDTPLLYSSAMNMDDIDKKLLQGPVVENQLTSSLCSPNKHSYIYGHSEPVSSATAHHEGSHTFTRLTELSTGDIITVTNKNGVTCSYKVKHWEVARTESDGKTVSIDTFNRVFYPDDVGDGLLTIQTCKKGSATDRMILRAELIR